MNKRRVKKYILPLINKYSHVPFINSIKQHYKQQEHSKQNIIIESMLREAEKVMIDLPLKPNVCIADFGEDVVFKPINDNKLKYENFCNYNGIPYQRVSMNKSSWFDDIRGFDIMIWSLSSSPSRLEEARSKLFFLEKFTSVQCYPRFEDAYLYEDKVRQYYLLHASKLPVVSTFISHNINETNSFIASCKYPIVSKISTGSASVGVEIVRNYGGAKKMVNKIFSSGMSTHHSYLRQKDYVYFQEYIDAEYDLRIIVVGNKAFGYYRMTPKNDFRASGADLVVKKALPIEAIRIAFRCKEAMGTDMVAVDMIKPRSGGDYQIIEASIFCRIDTAEQLHVDDVPGFYEYCNDSVSFHKGRFWVQDLLMSELVNRWSSKKLEKT